MAPRPIRLLLADVDGTLVTPDKVLTDPTIAAVAKLKEAGILFAVTSSRPPRGMSMLVEPLELSTPIAAFNGGLFAHPDMSVIEQRTIPDDVTPEVIELLTAHGMSVWVYRGADWFVLDPQGPYVAREAWTVRFDPTPIDSFTPVSGGVAKIVGVSDDGDRGPESGGSSTGAVRRPCVGVPVAAVLRRRHPPQANKGEVVRYLSKRYQIPAEEIATIGDGPNDVLMFARSGLSIAMGNASREVQRAARRVTTTNEDEGFANAVERFILP